MYAVSFLCIITINISSLGKLECDWKDCLPFYIWTLEFVKGEQTVSRANNCGCWRARTCARGREKDVYLYFRKELYLFSFIVFVLLIADERFVVFFFISAYFMSYWMYIAFTYLFRNTVIIHMKIILTSILNLASKHREGKKTDMEREKQGNFFVFSCSIH